MKQNTKTLSALLLALVLSLSLILPVSAAESGTALDEAARATVNSAMTYGQATQASWAVWQDGKIISSGSQIAKGDGGAEPLKGESPVYGAGSVSKIYTTVAVMQLAEAGKLELDTPVVKYLPAFKMADPRYKDITVRMLLNHSSGLMGSSFTSGMLFDDPSPIATDELLNCLAGQRLKADPGAFSVYCNDGFTLAELVVEAVSGVSFEEYLRQHIFDPAGLKETYFPSDQFESRRADIFQAGDTRPLPKDCLGVVGAGGLYATAEDVAAFGGSLTKSTLLKKASLDAMAAPEYANGLWPEGGPDALSYGLGWDCVEWYPFSENGITALVKGGDTQYYHAGLVVLPEYKLAAAVLSSGGVSTYNEMAASQMLLSVLREKEEVVELRLRLPAAEKAPMPKELLDHAGYYGSLTVYQVELSEDGTLTMRYPATPDFPPRTFYYYSDGTFRDGGGTSALRLVEEDNGEIYLYQWAFADLSGLGYLPTSNYAAMKLPENKIDPALQEAWASIMGGAVLPMNERYSSQIYASLGALLQVDSGGAVESAPGYIGSLRIEDETHARFATQVPGTGSRDGSDIELRRDAKGNLWFYQSSGGVYMDMNAVPTLSTGSEGKAASTIQPDGYARWYKVGDSAGGKTMTVQMPKNAGFWVYDAKGKLVASSVLWDDASAKLSKDGLIVFAGDPGARFELTFS